MTADSRKLSTLNVFQETTLNSALPTDLFLDLRVIGLERRPTTVEVLSITATGDVLLVALQVDGTDTLDLTGPKREEGVLVNGQPSIWHAYAVLGRGVETLSGTITFSSPVPRLRTSLLTSAVGNFVTGVETPDGAVSGDVKIKAVAGCRVSGQDSTFYIALEPTFGRSCKDFRCNDKVFKLFGVRPEDNGNVTLVSGDGLAVIPSADTHSIDIKTVTTDECNAQ